MTVTPNRKERHVKTILGAMTAATIGAVLLLPTAALAKDGDVRVVGSCTASTTSKLKLSAEDGGIEVEFEVDQNRNGVRWTVTLQRNGTFVGRRVGVTRGPSGSFEARFVTRNGSGADRFVARATNGSGERCTARTSF
jgi:hypothetical protein